MLYRRIDLAPPDADTLLQLHDQTLACLDPDGSVLYREHLNEVGQRVDRFHRTIATAYGLELTKCQFGVDPTTGTAHIDYPLTDEEAAAARGLG